MSSSSSTLYVAEALLDDISELRKHLCFQTRGAAHIGNCTSKKDLKKIRKLSEILNRPCSLHCYVVVLCDSSCSYIGCIFSLCIFR